MQEIIFKIFQALDFETLKECHLVSQKWYRIATGFLFRRVVCDAKNMAQFNKILSSDNLSTFIRVISIENASDVTGDLIWTIFSDQTLRQLREFPTVCVFRQYRQNEFITTLTGTVDFENRLPPGHTRLLSQRPTLAPSPDRPGSRFSCSPLYGVKLRGRGFI
jgi:hypothetical protein